MHTIDAVATRYMSKACSTSQTRPVYLALSARLESFVRYLIAIIPPLLEDAVVCLLGQAGHAMESSPDTEVISVIQIVVNRALDEAFLGILLLLDGEGDRTEYFIRASKN